MSYLKCFHKGLNEFGKTISILVNSGLLIVVYSIGVGISSIFAKLTKKHFLETQISEKIDSYWTDLNLKKKSFKEYYRQF